MMEFRGVQIYEITGLYGLFFFAIFLDSTLDAQPGGLTLFNNKITTPTRGRPMQIPIFGQNALV